MTVGELRRAVRSVSRAELGKRTCGALRRRKLNVVFRSQAPLVLQFLLADLEGRLLWRSACTFLVLEPPLSSERRRRGRTRLLHVLNRWWDSVVLFVPAALALVAGTVAFFVARSLVVALVLCVVSMLWVSGLMFISLFWQGTSLIRALLPSTARVTRDAAEGLKADSWSIAVCHVERPADVKELLRDALERVDDLAADFDAEHRVLVCPPEAITTSETAAAVRESRRARSLGVHGWDLLLISEPGRRAPVRRPPEFVGGAVLLLVTSLVMVLVLAQFVTDWEEQACLTACTGGLTRYPEAVFWVLRHFLVVGIPGAQPATFLSKSVALLMPFLFAVVLLNVVRVVRAGVRRAREERTALLNRIDQATTTSTVLVLVANRVEHEEVLASVGTEVERKRLEHNTVFDLGVISRAHLLVARTGQGTDGSDAATLTTETLIREYSPDYVLMVGICYGLRKGRQQIGDVVVSERLLGLNWRKETDDRPILRGPMVKAPPRILDRCHAAAYDWKGGAPDFGLLLSESVLVDSKAYRARLLELAPDALGGETEMAGVYGACERHKVDWIAIKAISDWGMGKTDGRQREAARNAADFMAHLVKTGGLDPLD